jgi:hypothetical protein
MVCGNRRSQAEDMLSAMVRSADGRPGVSRKSFLGQSYWTVRLKRVKTPFRLILRNGMTPPIPVLTVRIDKIVTDRRRGEYQLHIGRVLKVEHWDRKTRKQKR